MRKLNPVLIMVAILLLALLVLAFCSPRAGAQDNGDCIVLRPDGTWAYIPCEWPTAEVPPTETPSPSATPSPSPTPTNTPTPTTSPTAVPECYAIVVTDGDTLSVRDKPWGTRLGTVPSASHIIPTTRWVDEYGDWWFGHHTLEVFGYSHGDYLAFIGDCTGIEDVTPAQTRAILQGPHCLLGVGCEIAANYAQQQTAFKVLEGTWALGAAVKQANPDIWLLCRSMKWDGVAHETNYDPDAAWELAKYSFPSYCDAIELENEHAPTTDEGWRVWSDFSIGIAEHAAAAGFQYCAFSLGPGWPELNEFIYLYDYFAWVAEHPLPDGRYHCVAAHASVYAPWSRSDMPWVNEEYIAGRWYKANVIYKAKYDFDLAEWPGILAITEIGLSDGYSGNWTAPYNCNELASAYWETVRTYADHSYPHVYIHWNFGRIGMWTSDHDCASTIWG